MNKNVDPQPVESAHDPLRSAKDDRELRWRDLALQFDAHRMQAIGLLKFCIDKLPVEAAETVKQFLNTPPTPGSMVLAKRFNLPLTELNVGSIHARLHAARRAKKLSMQQMAVLVGVQSWQTIQQWEKDPSTGKKATSPKLDRLPLVAEVLGVSVEFLILGTDGLNTSLNDRTSDSA